MKSILNISILLLFVSLFSCSSDDSSNNNGEPVLPAYPMDISLDDEFIQLENTNNLSNPLGGVFGEDYQLLYASAQNTFTTSGRQTIHTRKVEMKLAIPKSNISLGEHNFLSSIEADGYFADLDIKIDNVVQTVNTTSGSITIVSIDDLTNLVTGTFELITNDGTNQNHTVTGSFEYILVE